MTKKPRPAWIWQNLNADTNDLIRPLLITVAVGIITLASCTMGHTAPITCDDRLGCSDWLRASSKAERPRTSWKRRHSRHASVFDANGNAASVRSKSGVVIKVAPPARAALQCVVDYVESHGVKIKYMRGYGSGTVRGSLHPSGRAIDINQTARNITRPAVPRAVSNAAADHCGVISGARWGYADNGHWNLMETGRPSEPWPRVVRGHSE